MEKRSEDFEMDMSCASDAYKEINGVRPRHLYSYWRTLSDEDMRRVYDDLAGRAEKLAIEAREAREARQR
jgi:hypothetical protein